MTTTVPVNPPQPSAGNIASVVQSPNVTYVMPPVQQDGKQSRIVRPVPGVRCLSIATIVIGGVLVVLGIIAIVLKARNSYIANPIWTGLLLLVTTGILGIFVYQKKNFCMNIAFLVMTIISSVFAYQLMECMWFFVMSEWYECYPGPGHYSYDCSPIWTRTVVGVAIILCAIAALVLCIISCSVTIYGTFTCCYNCCRCCRSSSTSSTVQYSSHAGIVMTQMDGQSMQVMAAPQMIPGTQQTSSQPLLVAAPQPGQPYPQHAPPAYMASPVMATPPQAFVVSSNQQLASGIVSVQSGNPSAQSGNTEVAESKPHAPADTVQTSLPGQIAEKPQNWQKF